MKRIITIPVLLALTVLFFSCGGKNTGTQAPGVSGSSEKSGASAPASTDIFGYILRVNSSLYALENNTGAESDKTKWFDSMILGEKVIIVKERRLTWHGDGKAYDFTEVRREDGKSGFAWASHVAPDGILAVVVDEKANLYKSPRDVDVTGQILSRKTVVVMYPDTENRGFIEVRGYDPVADANRKSFIRADSLSKKESDIQSSVLWQTAEPLKNEGSEKIKKDALLETALKNYPDSVFYPEINMLVNPNARISVATEPAGYSYMFINDDNVNVRDLPDTSGKVVGKLNNNVEVTITERTVNESTIDGQKSHWYHITEPFEGWVFGAFLDL